MYPELEEVKRLAKSGEYKRIPVCRELYADRFTPVEVMRTLRAAGRHCFLLESAENNQRWGRYSFLGYEPELELTCTDGVLRVREAAGDGEVRERTEKTEHPGAAIRSVLRERTQEPENQGNAALLRRPRRLFLIRIFQVRGADASLRRRVRRLPRRGPDAFRQGDRLRPLPSEAAAHSGRSRGRR